MRFSRDEQHLTRSATQRPRREAVIRFLDDEADLGTQLGQARSCVEPNAVFTLAGAIGPRPDRVYGENSRKRVQLGAGRLKKGAERMLTDSDIIEPMSSRPRHGSPRPGGKASKPSSKLASG